MLMTLMKQLIASGTEPTWSLRLSTIKVELQPMRLVEQRMEMIPFHTTAFGRGKKQDFGEDYMQYAEPGFLPTRDNRGLEGLAPEVRKAIEWGE